MKKIIQIIAAGIAAFIGFLLLILIIGLIVSYPVMWLWNGCLVGTVAGITPITSVWHAWGLLILCGLLFKSSSK
jgi:hypothetical protein